MNKPNNTPPPWSEAPLWAMYIAQDEDGAWFAYEKKPKPSKQGMGLTSTFIFVDGGESMLLTWDVPNPDWRDTLQKRPGNE